MMSCNRLDESPDVAAELPVHLGEGVLVPYDQALYLLGGEVPAVPRLNIRFFEKPTHVDKPRRLLVEIIHRVNDHLLLGALFEAVTVSLVPVRYGTDDRPLGLLELHGAFRP